MSDLELSALARTILENDTTVPSLTRMTLSHVILKDKEYFETLMYNLLTRLPKRNVDLVIKTEILPRELLKKAPNDRPNYLIRCEYVSDDEKHVANMNLSEIPDIIYYIIIYAYFADLNGDLSPLSEMNPLSISKNRDGILLLKICDVRSPILKRAVDEMLSDLYDEEANNIIAEYTDNPALYLDYLIRDKIPIAVIADDDEPGCVLLPSGIGAESYYLNNFEESFKSMVQKYEVGETMAKNGEGPAWVQAPLYIFRVCNC